MWRARSLLILMYNKKLNFWNKYITMCKIVINSIFHLTNYKQKLTNWNFLPMCDLLKLIYKIVLLHIYYLAKLQFHFSFNKKKYKHWWLKKLPIIEQNKGNTSTEKLHILKIHKYYCKWIYTTFVFLSHFN